MKIKPGAEINGLHYLLWYAAAVADYLHQAYGFGEATITSALDGADSFGAPRVAFSDHPLGRAFDLRFWNIPAELRASFAAALQNALGGAFRVVLESDHIHVELA